MPWRQKYLRMLDRRMVRRGLVLMFAAAILLALVVLNDVARNQEVSWDEPFLIAVIVVLLLTGLFLFVAMRGYLRTRRRLARVERHAHEILRSLSVGVITCDLAGVITHVNERARGLAEIAVDAEGRPYAEALARVPVLAGCFDRLVGKGEEFGGMVAELAGEKGPATLRMEGRFLASGGGHRIGAMLQIQDVSQLKLLDQEVRRTEKLAGLGTLAAGIAHEIKNPLAGLSINTQLLEEAISAGDAPPVPKAGKHLGVIQSEIRRLQGIVDNFVSFARSRPIERAPATLEKIMDSILSLIEPECSKRKIELVREGFAAAPARYLLDEGQLQQALLNIAINAMQAMEGGGTLTCRLGRVDSFVTAAVTDTGPGIPPDVRERIFDLFYTTRRGGTGLGLYLAQRIVAEHKGYINVSTGSAGTTFTVGVPAEVAP